jgi:3' exoribonuclease, RNase T-like
MNFIFLDTETGGLDSKVHSLLSIAAVYGEITGTGLTVLSEFAVQVLPETGTAVDPYALLGVQNLLWADLDEDLVETRLSEKDALTRLGRWLATDTAEGVSIFAHNAEFDRNFISAAVRRSGQASPYLRPLVGRDTRWSCTRYLAEALIAFKCMDLPKGGTLPDGNAVKPGVSLDALCLHFGLEGREGDGHGALEDARLGAHVLEKLARLAGWV